MMGITEPVSYRGLRSLQGQVLIPSCKGQNLPALLPLQSEGTDALGEANMFPVRGSPTFLSCFVVTVALFQRHVWHS